MGAPYAEIHGLCIAILLFQAMTLAQTGGLNGRVIDAATGEAIPGAIIVVLGTDLKTFSDTEGLFSISEIPSGTYAVHISVEGYEDSTTEDIEIRSGPAQEIEFALFSITPKPLKVFPRVPMYLGRNINAATEAIEFEEELMWMDEREQESPAQIASKQGIALSLGAGEYGIEDIKWGHAVFNTPPSMQLSDTKDIHLVLSKIHSVEMLNKMIKEEGKLQDRKLKISELMLAELKGHGFAINPIKESVQGVDPEGSADWTWQITALEPGVQKLYLSVYMIINQDGVDRPYSVLSLHEEIEVYVTWQQKTATFWGNNWKWLWIAIVAPFIGWIWEHYK